MKTNHIKAVLIVALLTMACSTTFAQLYKTDYTTKIVLTNSGFPANPANMVTLTAPSVMPGPYSLIMPTTAGTTGYFLTAGVGGQLSWTDPAAGITLTGDVNGPLNANVVNSVQLNAGPSIALAINTNTAPSIDGRQLNHDLTLTTAVGSPYALGIDLAHDNTWTSMQTYNGVGKGITVGSSATLAVNGINGALTVTGASGLKYVDGFQQAGYVLTSDINGNAKWTDPGLSVVLTGDVNGPANANVVNSVQLNAGPSIALAINTNTAPSINGNQVNHDATLLTAGSTPFALGIDLNHSNTWNSVSGSQTFGATAQTPGVVAFADPLPIGTTNTLYRLTGTGTATGMANGVDGRNVTLTNTGGAFITLTSNAGGANQFLIPGGDPVIMGPNATVVLQYDGSAGGWRVIGGF